jgi:ATP-dependent DNA helicase PIF1
MAFSRDIVHVQLLTGQRRWSVVMLPRCTFSVSPEASGLPFTFIRTQFPLSPAYCVTVHKSQGQTFSKVGLYFTTEPFAHGQLYVALSRVGCWDQVEVYDNERLTNVVHTFLLQQ